MQQHRLQRSAWSENEGNFVVLWRHIVRLFPQLDAAMIYCAWTPLDWPRVAPQARPAQVGGIVHAAVKAGESVAKRSDPSADIGPRSGSAVGSGWPAFNCERTAMCAPTFRSLQNSPDLT